ncbi:MAG: 8-oxo-dGTP diphosphatase MutT [Planctomycetota bacterium]
MKQVDVCIGIVVEKLSTIALDAPARFDLAALRRTDIDSLLILITRRKPDAVLGGCWELPGGKLEQGETQTACLHRELQEEVGIEVEPLFCFESIEHRYEHAHVRLIPYLCSRISGRPQPIEVEEARWVTPRELSAYPFPPPNAPLLASLIRLLEDGIEADQQTTPLGRVITPSPSGRRSQDD